MKRATLLRRIYKRIKDPEHWTTETMARDATGFSLESALDPAATRWCVMGALHRAWPTLVSRGLLGGYLALGPRHGPWRDQIETLAAVSLRRARAEHFARATRENAMILVNNLLGHEAILQDLRLAIKQWEAGT